MMGESGGQVGGLAGIRVVLRGWYCRDGIGGKLVFG